MGSGTKYTPEFRADTVRMVIDHSRPTREVAEQAGIRADTLRTWIRRARREGLEVAKKKLSYQELEAELQQLRTDMKAKDRELADEKKRVEFLGKAASFFAAENYDQPTGTK